MLNFINLLMEPIYSRISLSSQWIDFINNSIVFIIFSVVILSAGKIVGIVFIHIVQRIIIRTKVTWDDQLLKSGLFKRIAQLIPVLLAYGLFPLFFYAPDELAGHTVLIFIRRIILAYSAGSIAYIVTALLDGINLIYMDTAGENAKKKPIKGYIQLAKIIVYIIGGVLVVTTIADISPIGILSGIGAMSAILLLVFKDSIMGFVSSLQLSANDMVRIGDWIEMPKYNADGDVIDITLQSIVVQNWDKTITTIPIYALVADSFKNWRGMQKSGGRRIKRSITIDMRSVRFLSQEEIIGLERFPLLSGYIQKKIAEIEEFNRMHTVAEDDYVSGRHLTNLGTFRAYAEAYIESLPTVSHNMTHIVRQLQPDANGIPLELYLFTNDIRWIYYENIQSDIFDHLLAVMPEFGIRVFQNPSATDFHMIADAIKKE